MSVRITHLYTSTYMRITVIRIRVYVHAMHYAHEMNCKILIMKFQNKLRDTLSH